MGLLGCLGVAVIYMDIRKIAINDLKPARYNPRKDLQPGDSEYEKIKMSINEFGFVEPLVVNKNLKIIGGHQRFKVLRDMGVSEVDCVVVDLDEQKEKALNIALNKISGDWDKLKLKEVFLELDILEFDLELTGFDLDEVDKLLGRNNEFEDEPEVKFAEDLLLAHNYIILYFDNEMDWNVAVEKYGIEKVSSSHPNKKTRKMGWGRVVRGADYL